MSFVPLENLSPAGLVAQYVIEYRGRGHFLPYDEHRILSDWLDLAGSSDALLLILEGIVPEFYGKAAAKTHPPSLARLDKKVRTILSAARKHS